VEGDVLRHGVRDRLHRNDVGSCTGLVDFAQVSKLLVFREVMRGESSDGRWGDVMVIG